ncbi:hypothetical protein ACHAWF_005307 [Thalassiosira exigua]
MRSPSASGCALRTWRGRAPPSLGGAPHLPRRRSDDARRRRSRASGPPSSSASTTSVASSASAAASPSLLLRATARSRTSRSVPALCASPLAPSPSATEVGAPPRPTLFDLPGLTRPSEFLRLAEDAARECDALRRSLASSLSSSSPDDDPSDEGYVRRARRTLHALDDISNAVCRVVDAAELCRSVHACPEWRRAASDAFGKLSEYIGSLNADENLYRCLRRFVFADDGGEGSSDGSRELLLSRLPPEYRRMAVAMRKEFERDGIHLTYTKREEARELNNTIVGLETLFANNITEKTKFFKVEGDDMTREVDRIVPRDVLGQLVRAPASSTGGGAGGGLTLSSDALLCNTLLAHSPSAELRKEVYLQSNTAVPENLAVLDSLIRHRHLHSALLGFPSYAHRVLSDRMVGTPDKVREFLDRMEARCRPVFEKDMEELADAKRRVEGGGGDVMPWDVPFYATLIKARRQRRRWEEDGGGEDGDASSHFAGYFTVEDSLGGMKVLVRDLFGIDMREAEVSPEERWDVVDGGVGGGGSGGGGLRKFEFEHEEDGPLGTMYFDLHPRDGKFVHAAHFTIRCGRVREGEEDGDGGREGEDRQLPLVALVCNLSPSSGSSSRTPLSHAEVETLFHEFGHGLHSLLSRTAFQHLSGTRAAMDFVETPSHLFEGFARDPSFLSRTLARHYVTGMPMSERRARHLAASHADLRGIEVRTQIVHSRFDQALFGTEPCTPSLGGTGSTEAFERIHRQAGVPYAPGTHWHTRFGHLVTYGAGYYGYLYSQTFAADIWSSALSVAGSPGAATAREGGARLWREMLAHGGARDPRDMIRAVLGREPRVDPFFEG